LRAPLLVIKRALNRFTRHTNLNFFFRTNRAAPRRRFKRFARRRKYFPKGIRGRIRRIKKRRARMAKRRLKHFIKHEQKALVATLTTSTKKFFHVYKQAAKPILFFESVNPVNFFLFFNNSLRLKFLLLLNKGCLSFKSFSTFVLTKSAAWATSYFFYTRFQKISFTNLAQDHNFNLVLRKKFLKIFVRVKFRTRSVPSYYNALVRFFEFCSGQRVMIKYFAFLPNLLTIDEQARCLLWSYKLKKFRRILGARFFLNESLQVVYLSLKLKDPYFLAN
jgi:hypothetical protein